ncbi:MAG: serine/threonine protein kinase [Planctomycetes bacterium]|nr:serine/threonine protein kinase [Planctomycetota bacterium]
MTASSDRPLDHEGLLRRALAGEDGVAATGVVPNPDQLAPAFPGLRIVRLIGRGGMAAVYEAVQVRLERRVALKVLLPGLARDPDAGARFLREAKALASLSHRNVLTVFEVGESGGWFWMLTEFVDGANLRQLMELGRMSPHEALRIVPQVCEGLHWAHEHGVVHRDLKPENVLVDADGDVKLADFGLAKVGRSGDERTLTRTSMVFGTPAYMAPEQWRGAGAVDHRADIYSLGVMLYELLTGELPVGRFEPASRKAPVSPRMDEVIDKALAQEPAQRYQSARELERDVAAQRVVPPAATASPALRDVRVAVLPFVALAVLLLSMLGLAAFASEQLGRRMDRDRVAAEQAGRDALVAAIQDTVERGLPWHGELGTPSMRIVRTDLIDDRLALMLGVVWIVATLGLVAALGAWSARRIRASRTPLAGYAFARVVTWLPLVLLADALVLVGLDAGIRGAAHDVVFATAVAILLVWHAAALVGIVRDSKTVPPLPPGAARLSPSAAAALIACAVMLAVPVWASIAAPRSVAPEFDERIPTLAQDLIHASPATVFRRLGPPLAIRVDSETMTWTYFALDGTRSDALGFFDGRVVATHSDGTRLVPGRVPASGPALGTALQDLVAERGEAVAITPEAGGTEHRFRDGTRVVVAHGVVVRNVFR